MAEVAEVSEGKVAARREKKKERVLIFGESVFLSFAIGIDEKGEKDISNENGYLFIHVQ